MHISSDPRASLDWIQILLILLEKVKEAVIASTGCDYLGLFLKSRLT